MPKKSASFWQDAAIANTYLDFARSKELDWYEHEVNWPSFKALLPTSVKRVLDFGCAGGEYTDAIAQATGARVDACDMSEAMLARLKVQGTYHTFIWDGLSPRPDLAKAYDAVAAKLVLPFITDLSTFAQHIHGVLKPGGVLATSVHHPLKTLKYALDAGGDYFTDTPYQYTFKDVDNLAGTFYYRPVMGWIAPFLTNGFVLTKIDEPIVPQSFRDRLKTPANRERWLAKPKRLNFQLRKA